VKGLQIQLRSATAEDIPAIMELEVSTFAHHAWNTDTMLSEVLNPHAVYLVAEVLTDALGGAPALVGYAGLLAPIGSGDADIQTVAVDPAARSQGIGRHLVTELLEIAQSRQARRIFLEVRADNPHAITLYESLGFERIDVRRNYYQPDGIDAIVMRREELPGD
jgi:ribosomal-protein-alanine acetyltransferase